MRPAALSSVAKRANETEKALVITGLLSGTGSGRDTAVRTLQNMGMEISWVKDVTPMPHNGCRPKKRRRG